jgi:ubiquinone/menaquinone biosynthesis C-methylase UbiE
MNFAEMYSIAFNNLKADQKEIELFESICEEGTILEVGGGSGRTIGYIKGKHILLESDSDMLNILNKKIIPHKNCSVVEASCPKLPFPNERFAGVMLPFGTIGEINPKCFLLQEIHRVLKPLGKLYFSSSNTSQYKSVADGLRRTEKLGIKEFTFSGFTAHLPFFGEGQVQTHLTVQKSNQKSQYIVSQYFPNKKQLETIFEQIGFSILDNLSSFNEESMLFTLFLEKREKQVVNKEAISIENIYDSFSSRYSSIIIESKYSLPLWLKDKVDYLKGLSPSVIDLACGDGLVGKIINEAGVIPCSIFGIDISSEMLKQASTQSFYTGLIKFDLQYGLPGYSAISADLITAFGLFEFVSNPTFILKEIKRVLTIGGELFCSFEARSLDQKRTPTVITRNSYSQDEVKSFFSDINLKIQSIEEVFAYQSPTTGDSINYFYVIAQKENF